MMILVPTGRRVYYCNEREVHGSSGNKQEDNQWRTVLDVYRKRSDTYDNDHRSRPRVDFPVPLNKEVGSHFVDEFREFVQPPGVSGPMRDLQFENIPGDLE